MNDKKLLKWFSFAENGITLLQKNNIDVENTVMGLPLAKKYYTHFDFEKNARKIEVSNQDLVRKIFSWAELRDPQNLMKQGKPLFLYLFVFHFYFLFYFIYFIIFILFYFILF